MLTRAIAVSSCLGATAKRCARALLLARPGVVEKEGARMEQWLPINGCPPISFVLAVPFPTTQPALHISCTQAFNAALSTTNPCLPLCIPCAQAFNTALTNISLASPPVTPAS